MERGTETSVREAIATYVGKRTTYVGGDCNDRRNWYNDFNESEGSALCVLHTKGESHATYINRECKSRRNASDC